ncbi:MAG: hypothetical protein EOM58_06410 [Clostridia bacterium]|nr:hypothetical protein [Clostridia bacterium]
MVSAKFELPLCQDTGTLLFEVWAPPAVRASHFQAAAIEAIARSTADGILRRNSVDSLTGENAPSNSGPGHPVIHWHEHDQDEVRVTLVLKGGGCENVGVQYSLPDKALGAGRDLEGVRRCGLRGARRALVGSSQQFYYSIGFRPLNTYTWWVEGQER